MIAPAVAHAFARRCSNTRDIRNNRLGYVSLDVGSRFFLGRTTDLTDHNNRFSLRIVLEHFQDVDEVGARDWVTTDTNTGRLTEASVSSLFNRFVRQSTRTGNDTDFNPAGGCGPA